ncbi:MAG: ferritin-like domain-containing protein [Myxococcales bacterium]|nr:ferritin-like domain-containing protein [Myxococcales bacterium]
MVTFVNEPPQEPVVLPESGPATSHIRPTDLEQIAEIFQTPLTGSYAWNYQEQDQRIRKLYRLGKERNWNADFDINWERKLPRTENPMSTDQVNPYEEWSDYEALSEEQQLEFFWHSYAWTLAQFMHGEQGALLVASQLVSCAPTYEAKLYAGSQTFDEARHVEVFARYLRDKVGIVYPVNRHMKALLDKILTDPRWDLKFIGMQLIIESLALAAFNVQKVVSADELLRDILELVIRDEARHVAFGVTYLEQFVKTLSEQERNDRAIFALEACKVMRERIVPTDVYEHFGMDPVEGRRRFLEAGQMADFRNLLFTRIMPNLKRVGLLGKEVIPEYEKLGLMDFAELPTDGDINWSEMSAPLPAAG